VTEDQLVASIRAVIEESYPKRARVAGVVGETDDAALWQPSRSHRSAISTDMLVEGVDFTRAAMSLEDAGWRAMAANVSDLCAMGARPVLATVALGFPESTTEDEVVELYRGLASCAFACKIAIVGGDLSRAGSITIAITVVGEVRPSNAKMRSGARPGDVLAVTGPLGAAHAGLELTRDAAAIADDLSLEGLAAFRRPQPRIAEGRFLAASRNVTAMMDLSDGLSTDVDRLAAASGCGAEIESVPVADSARGVAQALGVNPQRFALAGGEDFELLLAVRARAFAHLALRYHRRFGRELFRVGRVQTGSGVRFNGASLERSGWDHFAPRSS
jgi:thiamine-monophosphate kinase